jgi:hypothetical protein
MVMQWIKKIRDTNQLSVLNDMKSSRWPNLFRDTLKDFNKLSDDYVLGVKLVEAKDESSADVVMRMASGPVSYTYNNRKQSDSTFGSVNLPHGRTFIFAMWYGSENRNSGIEKAAIFLPGNLKGGPGTEITADVMKVIAAHELVHACGLDDDDHGKDGLFYSPLSLSSGKMIVPEEGKNQKPMPPLWMDHKTIMNIKKYWVGLIDL